MFLLYVLTDLKDESRNILQIRGQIEIQILFLGYEKHSNSTTGIWYSSVLFRNMERCKQDIIATLR